ncbi:hypothetical protein BC827DRAFT_1156356 [Russula dissimulans]|nr:hypothetical protein BC827DRAFT_1156356 [Russula dissimulans]
MVAIRKKDGLPVEHLSIRENYPRSGFKKPQETRTVTAIIPREGDRFLFRTGQDITCYKYQALRVSPFQRDTRLKIQRGKTDRIRPLAKAQDRGDEELWKARP